MSSRKREGSPSLYQAAAAAKVQKPLHPLTSLSNASSQDVNNAEDANGEGLGDGRENRQGRRGKRGKRPAPIKVRPSELVSAPKLSPRVRASICSLLGEVEGHDFVSTIGKESILHPHMYNKSVEGILRSRNAMFGCASEMGRGVGPDSTGGGCVFIGMLSCRLSGCLDIGGLFRDCLHTVHFTLEVGEAAIEEEKLKWQVRIQVDKEEWCLPIEMDPILANTPTGVLRQALTSPATMVRLFLPYDSSSGMIAETFSLEFWAMERVCISPGAGASDPTPRSARGVNKLSVKNGIRLLLEALYPECSLKLLNEELTQGWGRKYTFIPI